MLKKSYISLLLMLFYTLHCAPGSYVRDGGYKKNYHHDNDEYSWSNNHDDPGYDINDAQSGEDAESYNNDNNKYTVRDRTERNESTSRNHIINKKSAKKNTYYTERERNTSNTSGKIITYRVKKNDNLTKIARKFNVSINSICKSNKIRNQNDIYSGMTLKIPSGNDPAGTIPAPEVKRPVFKWPLREIVNVKRDGGNGVNSIGIIITAKNGSRIYSSAAGSVEKIGKMRGFGKFVILKHTDRYFTIYSNLNKILVSEGQSVNCGITIGSLEGSSLHFQIDNSGKPIDPLKYLSGRR